MTLKPNEKLKCPMILNNAILRNLFWQINIYQAVDGWQQ